jgi:hypothetical protein
MIPSTILGLVFMASIAHGPHEPDIRGTRAIAPVLQCCSVPAAAPDLRPAWFDDPASHIRLGNSMTMMLKDVVRVDFRAAATQEARQAAIDAVAGCVVGGGGGMYYVRVPADGTLASLERQLATLQALPQINHATIYIVSGGIGLNH